MSTNAAMKAFVVFALADMSNVPETNGKCFVVFDTGASSSVLNDQASSVVPVLERVWETPGGGQVKFNKIGVCDLLFNSKFGVAKLHLEIMVQFSLAITLIQFNWFMLIIPMKTNHMQW